jgi:hypothetical protein
MPSFVRRHFNSLVILVIACLFCALLVKAQSQDDWDWLEQNFNKALDTSLPFQKDRVSCIAYRSHESLQVGDLECSFVITDDGHKLIAHLRELDTLPIGGQLLKLHRIDPSRSASSIVSDLKFKDWDLTETECPAVKSQYEKFHAIRFNLAPDTLTMDPKVHEFHVSNYSGTMDLRIVEETNPLVKWALETQHRLKACGPIQKPVQH